MKFYSQWQTQEMRWQIYELQTFLFQQDDIRNTVEILIYSTR